LVCLLILGIVLLSGCTSSSSSNSQSSTPTISVSELKSGAVDVLPTGIGLTYNDLMRNPDNYENYYVHITGGVVQVQESTGNRYYLRVATENSGYGWYDKVFFVVYEGSRLLEDDVIEIWGQFEGLYTYTAVLGNSITIPEIRALHTEMIQEAD